MPEPHPVASFDPVVEVLADADSVGARAAALIAGVVDDLPGAVLGFPTGATPGPTYRALEALVGAGEADFTGVSVFLLDEYLGLGATDPRSYRATIRREAAGPLGVPDGAVFGPEGDAADPQEACQRYEDHIDAAGGIDMVMLGIGRNGHIGFNEPGTPFNLRTHITALSDATRVDNARYFGSVANVPTHAITQGPATIGDARRILLVATGAAKAPAIARALTGEVDEDCPASILRTHPDVRVLVDPDAAAGLGEHVRRVARLGEG